MEFVKEKNYQIARGKHGFFKIKKIAGRFHCCYVGKTNGRVFNFPPNKKILDLKLMVQSNEYWEK